MIKKKDEFCTFNYKPLDARNCPGLVYNQGVPSTQLVRVLTFYKAKNRLVYPKPTISFSPRTQTQNCTQNAASKTLYSIIVN